MATVGEKIAKEIIAADGYYGDDPRVARVIEYTNMVGAQAWAIEYAHEVGRYAPSVYVRNPQVRWEAS